MEHFSSSWHHRTTNKMHLSDEDSACGGPSAVYRLWRSFRWWVIAEDLGTAATSEADTCARNTWKHTCYAEPLPPVGWCSCVCSISWWSGGCNHRDAHLSGTESYHCIIVSTDTLKIKKNATFDHMIWVADTDVFFDSDLVIRTLVDVTPHLLH